VLPANKSHFSNLFLKLMTGKLAYRDLLHRQCSANLCILKLKVTGFTMKANKLALALALGVGGGCWATLGTAWAAGNVDTASGEASVVSAGGKPRGISKGDRIVEGDTIVTGSNGEVLITTDDSGVLAVRPSSRLTIDAYKVNGNDKDSVVLSLLRGSLRSITGWISKTAPKNYRVTTNTATIGIRGTDHEVSLVEGQQGNASDDSGTWSQVTEGATTLQTSAGVLEQTTGTPSATGRVKAGDQAPAAAVPPANLFVARPTDSRMAELKKDAQTNQLIRLNTRQQQVTQAGGVSAQGNPKVSTQCTPDAPAQKAFDALLRAYEQGDIAFLQRHLNPALIGYGSLINDVMTSSNTQRQTRIQVKDRQMQCGSDVASIDFAWEKYFLDSVSFQPVITRGRGSVLITGLAGGQWGVQGIAGDSPFTPAVPPAQAIGATPVAGPVSGGSDGLVSVNAPSVFFNPPTSCTIPPAASPYAVAFVNTSNPPQFTVALTYPNAACTVVSAPQPVVCSVSIFNLPGGTLNLPGTFQPNPLVPNCTVAWSGAVPANALPNQNVTLSASPTNILTFASGAPGSVQTVSPALLIGVNQIYNTAGIQTTANITVQAPANSKCTASFTVPANPPPQCTPVASTVPVAIQVSDADVTTPTLQVQVQASNGDSETLALPRVSPGVYRLAQVPIVLGASTVAPGSGRFEIVGASPTAVTLTIRYTDAKSATGINVVRQTTLTLSPNIP
jgi:FecR protein